MSKQETEPIIRASEAAGEILEMSLNSHLRPLRGSSTIFSLLLSTMTQKHCEDSGGHWRGVGAICNEQQERGGGVTLADVAPTHPPTFYLFLSPYLHNSPYHPTPQSPSPPPMIQPFSIFLPPPPPPPVKIWAAKD